jgi:mannose-1-phosphate guanylyltransferase
MGEADGLRAVVLVGGQGTRLRPLTLTTKKELLPLVDRTILDHTLDRLARHGVEEAVMSSPYLEESFRPVLASRDGAAPAVRWITETEALDTGGAIVNALDEVGDDPCFALNGDILTDLDMTAMRAFHDERDAAVTIALQRVPDARAFGLVATDPGGRVLEFREKPQDLVPGDINAGTYLLDPAVLRRWTPDRPISIEREIFPALIAAGEPVYGFVTQSYWIDLGTPDKYLQAHADLLAGRFRGVSYPSPWVHPEARIEEGAELVGPVCVGPGARVAAGARIEGSVLHAGASVEAGAQVRASILGREASVGEAAALSETVVADGARIPAGAELRAARVAADGSPWRD